MRFSVGILGDGGLRLTMQLMELNEKHHRGDQCCAPAEWCGIAQDQAQGTVNYPQSEKITNHTKQPIQPTSLWGWDHEINN